LRSGSALDLWDRALFPYWVIPTELIQLGRERLQPVMNDHEVPAATGAAIARQVSAFYRSRYSHPI